MAKKNLGVLNKSQRFEELVKCGNDPKYFIKKYIKISHPTKGLVKFDLYPFQEECLDAYLEHKKVIVNKSRQLGLSTVSAAYALWMALFHRERNILIIATKLDVAKNFIRKVRANLDGLPDWLVIPKIVGQSVKYLQFSNGSQIKAVPTSQDAGRSEALSLLIVDEAAHVEGIDELWLGLSPTLSTGGSAILISSPSGVGTLFHKLWVEAGLDKNEKEEGRNGFYQIELPWTVHPERDQRWFDEQRAEIIAAKGERGVAQEMLCVGDKTNIITIDGCKKANEIKINDLVLTHKGVYKKVTNIQQRKLKTNEDLYKISLPGNRKDPLYITSNHPIYNYHFHKPKNKKTFDYLNELIEKNNFKSEFTSIDDLNRFLCKTNKIMYGVLHPLLSNELINKAGFTWDLSELLENSIIYDDLFCRYNKQNKSVKTKRFIETDYELGKYIGLAVAEGCITNNYSKKNTLTQTLQLAFKTSEELETHGKFIRDFYRKNGIKFTQRIRTYSDCFTISTTNKFIISLYKKYVTNLDATQKHLYLETFFDSGHEFILGYLDGHFFGDGDHLHSHKKYNNGNKIKLICSSEKLLFQVRTLLTLFGHYGRIGHWKNKPYYLELDGLSMLDITKLSDLLLVPRNKNIERKTSKYKLLESNNHIVGRIQWEKVPHKEVNFVVDIEVEEDESFIAQGLVLHNCSFMSSGDTFIKGETLDRLLNDVKPPQNIQTFGRDEIWIWQPPKPNIKYVIGADVARGDGEDYSAFNVIDTINSEVVADFKGKPPPDKFAELLLTYGTLYNNALICQELNNVGIAAAIKLKDSKYSNLYYEKFMKNIYMSYVTQDVGDEMPGFTTNANNRIEILAKLENVIRNKQIKLHSKRLFEELQTFIWKGNKPQSQKGYNDDLVLSLAIACQLYEAVANNGNYDSIDMAMSMLKGMSRDSRTLNPTNGQQNTQTYQVQLDTTQGPISKDIKQVLEQIKQNVDKDKDKEKIKQNNRKIYGPYDWLLDD